MPFGGMSTWDDEEDRPHHRARGRSYQCLSAGCPLGTHPPSPNRWKSPIVANAFRRDVHLGPHKPQRLTSAPSAPSPMPFGGMSTWDLLQAGQLLHPGQLSPMPFGGMSTWDWGTKVLRWSSRTTRHQCLSAECPLGTGGDAVCMRADARVVTNAFRRDVHLGQQDLGASSDCWW